MPKWRNRKIAKKANKIVRFVDRYKNKIPETLFPGFFYSEIFLFEYIA